MRHIKSLLGLISLGVLALTGCQDDFDAPGMRVPQATLTPNISIADFKAKYWSDDNAYIDKITADDGERLVVAGRVVSSDASGNIYKNLVIEDETAALAISINYNSIYNSYRIGQEIVIDLTDMYVGKYRGLQQLGFPSETTQKTFEATFMPMEFFKEHVELNGLPEPSKVEPMLLTNSDFKSATPASVRYYQSRLVRFNNCHFEEGGKLEFTDGSKITSNRTLVLSDGTTLTVRTSGYSNFWSDELPEGNGDVIGILSYFNTGNTADPWQLLLRSRNDLLNFGNPTPNEGTRENPYTVDRVIEMENNNTPDAKGWVSGYIVGAVKPGTTAVTSNDLIEWTADVSMPNTLVIAPTPEIKEAISCLVVELPQGSALRKYGNLLDNPSNYKKEIKLSGTFAKVLGTWGIVGNNGTADEFEIEGVTVPGGDEPENPDQPNPPVGDPVNGTVKFADCSLAANPTEFVVGNFKFVADKGAGKTAPAYHANSQAIRLYADNTLTISTVDGAPIDKMQFMLASDAKFKYTTFTPSTGTLAAQAKGDTDMNWTGYANSVTFTVGNQADFGTETGYGQIRITEVRFGTDVNNGGDTPVTPPDKPDEPTPGDGNGTEASPYNVTAALALNNNGSTGWVEGYIVGWVDGNVSAPFFSAPAQTANNILIAASADEKNVANCLVVQLPSRSDIRKALNLLDNPDKLGKKVAINGTFKAFSGGKGLTSPTNYVLK